jgi:hypothetical protein
VPRLPHPLTPQRSRGIRSPPLTSVFGAKNDSHRSKPAPVNFLLRRQPDARFRSWNLARGLSAAASSRAPGALVPPLLSQGAGASPVLLCGAPAMNLWALVGCIGFGLVGLCFIAGLLAQEYAADMARERFRALPDPTKPRRPRPEYPLAKFYGGADEQCQDTQRSRDRPSGARVLPITRASRRAPLLRSSSRPHMAERPKAERGA